MESKVPQRRKRIYDPAKAAYDDGFYPEPVDGDDPNIPSLRDFPVFILGMLIMFLVFVLLGAVLFGLFELVQFVGGWILFGLWPYNLVVVLIFIIYNPQSISTPVSTTPLPTRQRSLRASYPTSCIQ